LPSREDTLLPERVLFLETKEHPGFRTLLFGKEAVKTFLYKCSNSGKMNPLQDIRTLMGTKFSGSNAAPGIPLQKKALQKKALDFWSQVGPATVITLAILESHTLIQLN